MELIVRIRKEVADVDEAELKVTQLKALLVGQEGLQIDSTVTIPIDTEGQ